MENTQTWKEATEGVLIRITHASQPHVACQTVARKNPGGIHNNYVGHFNALAQRLAIPGRTIPPKMRSFEPLFYCILPSQ